MNKYIFKTLRDTDEILVYHPKKGRYLYNAHTLVEKLTEKQLLMLLMRVCKSEEKRVPKSVLEQIATDSLGHVRDALVILEKIIDLNVDEMKEAAQKASITQNSIIELCRALIGNYSWKDVSTILTGLKQEQPETIRRAILGYCSAILLKKDDHFAATIMEEMIEPFYNTGFPGLVFACYSIIRGG